MVWLRVLVGLVGIFVRNELFFFGVLVVFWDLVWVIGISDELKRMR